MGGDDGTAPEIRVESCNMEKRCIDLVIANGHLALLRIYKLMLDPPYSLSLSPLLCLPRPPRDVIRPQRQSQPRSGGVVLPDFHVPNAEGLSHHRPHFNPSSLPSLCSD